MLNLTMESVGSPRLSAWELWLVSKAKEERLKLEKKSEEASQSPFSMGSLQLFCYFDAFNPTPSLSKPRFCFVLLFTCTNTLINPCPNILYSFT